MTSCLRTMYVGSFAWAYDLHRGPSSSFKRNKTDLVPILSTIAVYLTNEANVDQRVLWQRHPAYQTLRRCFSYC